MNMMHVGVLPDKKENDDLDDIDLADPELNNAAIKIQAQFRGHRTRKQIDEVLTEEESKMAAEQQAETTAGGASHNS